MTTDLKHILILEPFLLQIIYRELSGPMLCCCHSWVGFASAEYLTTGLRATGEALNKEQHNYIAVETIVEGCNFTRTIQ